MVQRMAAEQVQGEACVRARRDLPEEDPESRQKNKKQKKTVPDTRSKPQCQRRSLWITGAILQASCFSPGESWGASPWRAAEGCVHSTMANDTPEHSW